MNLIPRMTIVPDDIPDDAHPLDGYQHLIEGALVSTRSRLVGGQNMAVTLLDAKYFIGRVEWTDDSHFTVGQSGPIHIKLIESVREV